MKTLALLRTALTVSTAAALLTGCGAGPAAMEPPKLAVAAAPAPRVLDKSLYAKDATGGLGEDDLQKVLRTPIDLELPARVGVVPLAEPFDASGKASLGVRSVASRDLAASLRGQPYFSQVSDVSTELPHTGGIEGLRLLAARYRLRYLLLFSERFEDDTHVNGWAWTYPTILGMFVTPGVTVQSRGVVQADLLDVRTGTILFSAVESLDVSHQSLLIGAARTHQELQQAAAAKAAKRLAQKVVADTSELVAFADRASHELPGKHVLPAPVASDD
ncbi:MAG TPA: hypothetical protein VHB21_05555 [Minicystis sp.]|nr:hypothetical protein [Minicystis sp.]